MAAAGASGPLLPDGGRNTEAVAIFREAAAEPRREGPAPPAGAEVVELACGRSGEGEAIHAILKSDFAGGMMPSGKFGANAC